MMRRHIGKIKVIVFLLFFISAAIGVAVFFQKEDKALVTDKHTKYNNADLVSKAMSKLEKKTAKEAEVMKDVNTSEKIAALTFQGLADTDTNKKVLKLLQHYNRKASFFVPGILAAEDSKTIIAIYKAGNKVESNTLSETKHMEKSSELEQVKDFCAANNIIKSITRTAPQALLCNSTEYDSDLLKAAYASGNKKVVKSTHYLNYQSFKSYEQVLAYVNNLKEGSILTFKMKGVLDEEEYQSAVRASTPAKDKAPDDTAKEEKTSVEELTAEKRFLFVVEWVLKALDEKNYDTVFVEDLKEHYDTDYDISFDELRERNQGALSTVYKNVETDKDRISLTFRGLDNKDTLNQILEFLEYNHLKATFFVTADDIINYPDRVKLIIDKGQNVANGGMTGKDLTTMSFDEICLEIYKCDKLLMQNYLINSRLFMPAYGKYNDKVLEAAAALGYQVVTYSKNPITSANAGIDEILDRYKNGFRRGDIVYYNIGLHKQLLNVLVQTYVYYIKDNFQVCGAAELVKDEEGRTGTGKSKGSKTVAAEGQSLFIQSTYVKPDYLSARTGKPAVKKVKVKGKKTNTQAAAKQVKKESKADALKKVMKALRKKNNGKKAEVINTVYTTEQALSFTFYGVSNTAVTDDVLDKLDSLNAKATFFVSEKDIKNNAAEIKKIADRGHEIGICLVSPEGSDYYSVCSSILNIQEQIKKLCNKTPVYARYAYYVNMTDQMLEAVSSTGCKVVWQNLALATSKLGVDATLEDVIKYAFNSGNIVVKRGYIIYIRMDYYTDQSLVGNLLLNIASDRIESITYHDGITDNGSSYTIKTLDSLLGSDKIYTYPVSDNTILAGLKDAISPGHLQSLNLQEQFEYMKGRYIGNPDANTTTTLPGFEPLQIAQLNKTGRFTDDRVLFLTFDDWGSDKPISQLLYVLNKYKIKATFFVRTSFVQDNPNLLRAIAEAGHTVGCHTDQHLSFADSSSTDEFDISGAFTSLTADEVSVRKTDLMTSYQKLLSIIGDVKTEGVPSLSKILRPPTLAMSKEGMEAIFDMGFQYIVSGDYSTHDYEETDPYALADKIENGLLHKDGVRQSLYNGSIIVLHMSDDSMTPTQQADITAHALDIAIPRLLSHGYQFAGLNEFLNDNSGSLYY